MKIRVGARIAIRRQRLNWTQFDLADRLKLSRAAVSHFESGRRQPDLETLDLLADTLGVTMDYLFGREDRKMTDPMLHHPEAEAYIDLYEQWLDEPCPAVRKELKAKMEILEARLKGETNCVQAAQ